MLTTDDACGSQVAIEFAHSNKGLETMSGGGKSKDADGQTNKAPVKADDKARKPPPSANDDEEIEDGDIATPKRDRDDEQQGL